MDKIAIIGLSCLLPGADNPEKYWQNLLDKKDLTSFATITQMGVEPNIFYAKQKGHIDKFYCLKGGYIKNFTFDVNGYQIPSDILQELDKMYQWSLYVAKQALEDSGYLANKSVLSKCGVILGNLSFPTHKSHHLFAPIYEQSINSALQKLLSIPDFKLKNITQKVSNLNGYISGYPASLIAQALSLSGVNFSLDAACASSLYSIKLACDYLSAGKADLMLAGAVSCAYPLFINMGFSIFQAYPENNQCLPLNKSSGGLIAGEGAGMVVLKRYEDALEDGDRIYGTIKGIGLSNDGKGKFVLQPNSKGQILAFERAYKNANINPNTVEYIECHATGTPVGDIAELNSMETFFSQYNHSPLLGSVKSNLGHLLTSAGIASLIKVILSFNKNIIPPTINITETLKSHQGNIGGENIVTSPIAWKQNHKRAGVSAFGFGGCNAHLILESNYSSILLKEKENKKSIEKLVNEKQSTNQKLAIIGMDAFFGGCDGLDALDYTIYEGKQNFILLPTQRWQGIETETELLKNYGFNTGKAPQGAYIKDFYFDFIRFKIPPKEEDQLIPQQLLILKVADRAIQDAGLKMGGNVAVIIAMETELALHQYLGRIDLSWQIKETLEQANINLSCDEITELEKITKDSLHPAAGVNRYTSVIGNIMASRIAALWDFSGAAFSISAGENSTFRALEVAKLMLTNHDVDAVVIGAIDLSGGVESVLLRQQFAAINTGINTLSFDENVNGWMVGEGAGAIVLKRYQTAKDEKDRIYAVIDAFSLIQNNHQDKSPEFVKQACKKAFENLDINPKDIGYLEVFGSGIPQEDEAEIKGILQAYQQLPRTNRDNHGSELTCCIGSIKTNIGHTHAASGIASLIKTVLCLYHRYIPATPNWNQPKHLELWKDSPFYVTTESRTWFLETNQTKRIAAINGLGIDNTYAHLILSEEISQKVRPKNYLQNKHCYLFPIAANNCEDLIKQINNLKRDTAHDHNLSILATNIYHSFQKSINKKYKLTLIARNQNELLQEINLAVEGVNKAFEEKGEWKTVLGSYFIANPLGKQGKVAFVYPGMGSSDIGLGKDIFRLFPQIYETFSNLATNISQVLYQRKTYPRSLIKIDKRSQAKKIEDFFVDGVAMCQSGISLSVLYTLILRDCFQIHPEVAFGYSLGEASGMLFALGVWQEKYHTYAPNSTVALTASPLFKTALCGDCTTGRNFFGLPINPRQGEDKFWISYLIKESVLKVKEVIKQEEKVYITFINTFQEIVIAGEPLACLRIIKKLNCRYIAINFDSILHSPIAKDEYDKLVELHTMPIQNIPNIKFYSGIDCNPLKLDINSLAHNSAKLCCQTINFPQLVNQVYQDGARIFIEIGAKNNCSRWIGEILQDSNHLAISSNHKGIDDYTTIIRLLAKLISHDVPVDLSPIYTDKIQKDSQGKSIIKKVTLGGQLIKSSIFTPENKKKFKSKVLQTYNHFNSNRKNVKQCMNIPSNSVNKQLENLKILQLQISVSQQLINQNLTPEEEANNIEHGTQKVENQIKAYTKSSNIVWDETDLLEFARGNITNVFGEDYQIIDSYTRRVRLPLPPYLLVSRVTKINAKKGEFRPCSLTTEYDIPNSAWYSVDGQAPGCIAVESGQCDLLLISYLGIDFENKGELVYRLLDCTLTFLNELPKEGDTLRYDIKINSFAKSGDNLLFFFSYECFVKEKMILKMDGGCAGFFSDQQLEQGKGIIVSDKEKTEIKQIQKQKFEPLLVCTKSSFNQTDIQNLTQGNLADCFGDHYYQYGLNPSLRLPPQKILMIDRITSIDPIGGNWGLGLIVAEKNLEPEHWYFPCHFKDDQVLAGSLISEGCSQILQFYLLFLGLHTCTINARFQPIYGLPQMVRCRGQVTPISDKLIYQMEVTEIGLTPHPYIKCNVDIILQDKIVVKFEKLGLQLIEKNPVDSSLIDYRDNFKTPPKITVKKPALLTEEQIQEFCTGSVEKCFGKEFAFYSNGRVKASRMPNTHLNLVSRVLEVKGERHKLEKGSTIITEYDVPNFPWYYLQNSSETIPYSILMEIGLQPCGFLSAYLGTTLLYPDSSLYFRNLDGQGTVFKDIDIRGKTITNTATLISSTNVRGMILQSFTFQLVCENEIFYQGEALFGHFSPDALANQVGLDSGKNVLPWYKKENSLNLPKIDIDLRAQTSRNKYYQINPNQPYYRLAKYQLDLLNEVKIIAKGGKYQQGYIYGRKDVKSTDWYFKCHFYQDPVMPGSLGIEAMLQAMQVYALNLDLGKYFKSPRFIQLVENRTIWKYRGQIPPNHPEMYLEVHIAKVDIQLKKITIIADASLWKPNMRIYEVKDLAICLMESD
ncbi:MAG: PfaB family protein [Mastigocoleus sp.]